MCFYPVAYVASSIYNYFTSSDTNDEEQKNIIQNPSTPTVEKTDKVFKEEQQERSKRDENILEKICRITDNVIVGLCAAGITAAAAVTFIVASVTAVVALPASVVLAIATTGIAAWVVVAVAIVAAIAAVGFFCTLAVSLSLSALGVVYVLTAEKPYLVGAILQGLAAMAVSDDGLPSEREVLMERGGLGHMLTDMPGWWKEQGVDL